MPKYHFEIDDGFRLEDPVGVDCAGEAHAMTVAKDIAQQIAADIADQSDFSHESELKVIVVDDRGKEVYKTKITR